MFYIELFRFVFLINYTAHVVWNTVRQCFMKNAMKEHHYIQASLSQVQVHADKTGAKQLVPLLPSSLSLT